MTTIPYSDPGKASFEELDDYTNGFLLSGSHPALATFPEKFSGAATLPQFLVVKEVAGFIVPATDGTPASGVLMHAVASGTPAGSVPVAYSGCFNPAALVWDASYTTEAKKLAAFNGAPTPTQITLRARG